ncbi:MAG: hypothetical protein QXN55_09095 [Candidatus Nitrosotenuis sp.]
MGFIFVVGTISGIVEQDPRVFLVLGLTIVLGVAAWLFSDVTASRSAKVLFRLQQFSWLHFILMPKMLDNKNYFLTQDEKHSAKTLFLLWVGSWSLVVSLAHHLVHSLGIRLPMPINELSNNFDVLIFAWLLTPIVAFLIIPISVMESTNIRLFLETKKIITTPTAPYRYLIGGFATISILFSILRGLEIAELITSLLYLPTPFFIMSLLYRTRSEKRLISNFKDYLVKRGISQKSIDLS